MSAATQAAIAVIVTAARADPRARFRCAPMRSGSRAIPYTRTRIGRSRTAFKTGWRRGSVSAALPGRAPQPLIDAYGVGRRASGETSVVRIRAGGVRDVRD